MQRLTALALLAVMPGAASTTMAFTNTFAKYPGYTRELQVGGTVSIMASGTDGSQVVLWSLTGLDTLCVSGAGDDITNGCGIHVHTGTSCEDASEVGGHYYATASDPWLDLVYVSDSSGTSTGNAEVTTGFSVSDMVGRAFVVHELDGGRRVACGILSATGAVSTSDFTAYPGYDGVLAVSGTVVLSKATETSQVLTWDFSGLDAACVSTEVSGSVTNGCGIHVHAGTSCDSADLVEGHLFSDSLARDPWLDVVYVVDASGASKGTTTVGTGLSLADMMGGAFVVHQLASGGRVACGLLGSSGVATSPSFSTYPGYAGNLAVAGAVAVTTTGLDSPTQQLVFWDLHGLDTTCSAGAGDGIPNGCGVHVHIGTTCASAELVGGHLYSAQQDPWQEVRYVSDSAGRSVGSVVVDTGLSLDELAGHAFVVHQREGGGRIACGILFPADSISVMSFWPYPGYDGDLVAAGHVTLAVGSPTSQVVSWNLTGLDAACNSPNAADGVVNGCGLHVHEGTACDVASDVGGHLFNQSLSVDPWLDVRYVSDPSGASTGTALVDTGLGLSDMVGKAFVIHRLRDGGRVACGILQMVRVAETQSGIRTTTELEHQMSSFAWSSSSTVVSLGVAVSTSAILAL